MPTRVKLYLKVFRTKYTHLHYIPSGVFGNSNIIYIIKYFHDVYKLLFYFSFKYNDEL